MLVFQKREVGEHYEKIFPISKKQLIKEMCAQNELGDCYGKGLGVTKYLAKAMKYYPLVADQGSTYDLKHL